jgi:hypothetical protein
VIVASTIPKCRPTVQVAWLYLCELVQLQENSSLGNAGPAIVSCTYIHVDMEWKCSEPLLQLLFLCSILICEQLSDLHMRIGRTLDHQ